MTLREGSGPGGFEGVGGLAVAAFEEMSVDVVGGSDRGVPEPWGDDVGVFSGVLARCYGWVRGDPLGDDEVLAR